MLDRLRSDVTLILQGALSAVRPATLLDRYFAAQPDIRRQLAEAGCVNVVAAGKAACGMAAACAPLLGSRAGEGLVVSTASPAPRELPWPVVFGGHPWPDAESLGAGRRALAIARATGESDVLLVLLSGGASALMAAPVASLALADKVRATEALMRAGVGIAELNAVRKHLSAVKGGQLAAACRGATVALAISDVVHPVEHDPSVIGSGPTVADRTTFRDALAVIDSRGLRSAMPPAALAVLEVGMLRPAETPKPGDPRLARSTFAVVGGRADAMEGARAAAVSLGYDTRVTAAPIVGEARVAGPRHVMAALAMRGHRTPLCVISSGETTVHVVGPGRGGRNQEFALAVVDLLANAGRDVLLASVGTDGIDGPTDAAGAVVDATTLERARRAGIDDPGAYLASNDAHGFFAALGDTVDTGPTGTNVADLQIILIDD
jgi:glycerate-2-kinase